MKPATAQILRAVGMLIEFAGLIAFVASWNDRRTIVGIELRHVALAVVALGFTLWMIGVAARLARARHEEKDR